MNFLSVSGLPSNLCGLDSKSKPQNLHFTALRLGCLGPPNVGKMRKLPAKSEWNGELWLRAQEIGFSSRFHFTSILGRPFSCFPSASTHKMDSSRLMRFSVPRHCVFRLR